MATFNETGSSTSGKDVAEQNSVMSNVSKSCPTFRLNSSVCATEELPKNLNFWSFLPLIDPLATAFNETRASTSRIYGLPEKS